MKPSLALLAALFALGACSSDLHETDTPRRPGDAPDDKSARGDASSHPPDPNASPPTSTRPGTLPEAAVCDVKGKVDPDFTIVAHQDIEFDGLVKVGGGDAGTVALRGGEDGGLLDVVVDGAASELPVGATVWASLKKTTVPQNPINSTITYGFVVSATEHGMVLLEQHQSYADGSSMSFLGKTVTFSHLCDERVENNLVTHASCETVRYYSATIHGDTDLTLVPGTSGKIRVGGIDYTVWLSNSYDVTKTSTESVCIDDAGRPAGLSISARVSH